MLMKSTHHLRPAVGRPPVVVSHAFADAAEPRGQRRGAEAAGGHGAHGLSEAREEAGGEMGIRGMGRMIMGLCYIYGYRCI